MSATGDATDPGAGGAVDRGAGGVRIRLLSAGDRAQWDPLWQGYLTFYKSSVPRSTTDVTFARLLDHEHMGGLVAVDDADRLAGVLHYVVHPTTWNTRPVCYLEDLFVDPQRRGAGAGRLLIEALQAIGRREGWADIYWMTAADNAVARRLYDRVAELGDWVRYEIPLTSGDPADGDLTSGDPADGGPADGGPADGGPADGGPAGGGPAGG